MKLKKLTQSQFNALYAIVEATLYQQWLPTVEDKLYQTIIAKLYQKLYKMRIMVKGEYNVNMSDDEALTFLICLADHELPMESFEGNFLNQTIAAIDKHYAVNASVEVVEQKNYLNKM